MFTKSILSLSVLALSSCVAPKPMDHRDESYARSMSFGNVTPIPVFSMDGNIFSSASSSLSSFPSSLSLSKFGGLSSLNNFDKWFGSNNFCGSRNVIVRSTKITKTIVCHTQQVTVIQQQLAVIVEHVKRVITTSICEVETQQIVIQQWIGRIQSFSESIRRVSSSSSAVTYDHSVAGRIGQVVGSDGSLNMRGFGFAGQSIGGDSVSVSGGNWIDKHSPASVSRAFQACQSAAKSVSLVPPTWSGISRSCGQHCSLVPPAMLQQPSSSSASASVVPLSDGSTSTASAIPAAASSNGSVQTASVISIAPSGTAGSADSIRTAAALSGGVVELSTDLSAAATTAAVGSSVLPVDVFLGPVSSSTESSTEASTAASTESTKPPAVSSAALAKDASGTAAASAGKAAGAITSDKVKEV